MRCIGKSAPKKYICEVSHEEITSESKHVFWNGVRYHPRSLTINRPYSFKLREAVTSGEAIVETMQPKNIYIYELSTPQNKKEG